MNLTVTKQQTLVTSKQYVDQVILNVSTAVNASISAIDNAQDALATAIGEKFVDISTRITNLDSSLTTAITNLDTSLTSAISTLDTSASNAIKALDSSVLEKLGDIYTKDEVDSTLEDYVTTEKLNESLGIAEGEEPKSISDVIDGKIDAAVTKLVGTAPETLDTLGEIAKALNEDASLYDTVVAAITLKADTSTLNDKISEVNDAIDALDSSASDAIDALDSSVSNAIKALDTSVSDALKAALPDGIYLVITVADLDEENPAITVKQVDDTETEVNMTDVDLINIFKKYYEGKAAVFVNLSVDGTVTNTFTHLPLNGKGIKLVLQVEGVEGNYEIIIKTEDNATVICNILSTIVAYPVDLGGA